MLAEQAGREGGAFVPVYGRRRIGKTALLRQFCRESGGERPTIFFVGKQAPADLQRKEFLAQAARTLDEPLLAEISPPDWKSLLLEVHRRCPLGKRLLLVFDEIQWTAAASPELVSVLQELWDTLWQRDKQLMLLVSGTKAFIEREVLGTQAPLHGRCTAQIALAPFGYREARAFQSRYSQVDAARTYFICGGVPAYLQAFQDDRSVEENIRRTILDEFAPLFREADYLLRKELREVQSYYAVLTELAHGERPVVELGDKTPVAKNSLAYYLSKLDELGFLDKHYPVSGAPRTNRQVRYRLSDPLTRFWFRFVFPNLSYLAASGADETLRHRIEPELDGYFGRRFAELCREALPALYRQEGVTANFEVGDYWAKDVSIDVVGHRGDEVTDLGACRWSKVSPVAVARELRQKVASYPNDRNARIELRVFARGRPSKKPQDVRWHSLADLYQD